MKQFLRYCFIFLAFFLSSTTYADEQNIVINELMHANVSYMLDGTYNYNGWVELYNRGKNSVNLEGFSFSDDYDNPRKFVFPKSVGTIDAGGYKIIFFGNNDLDAKNVNFKLDCDGASLYLYSRERVLEHAPNEPLNMSPESVIITEPLVGSGRDNTGLHVKLIYAIIVGVLMIPSLYPRGRR